MTDLTTIEVIGCDGGFWACALESWGGDVAAYALLLTFVLGCVGIVWAIWARGAMEDHHRQRPRTTTRLRVVAGPELHDGSWVRLVEPAPGYFRAEIYVERKWKPIHHDPSLFFGAAPRGPGQLRSR